MIATIRFEMQLATRGRDHATADWLDGATTNEQTRASA
jgi:hypothetical protein